MPGLNPTKRNESKLDMTIVRLVGGGDDDPDSEKIRISLDGSNVNISEVRRGLPQLQKELRNKWPMILEVRIERAEPLRLRNPIDPTSAREYATHSTVGAVYLAVVLAKEMLTPPAKEIGAYLRRWVRAKTKKKKRKRR
jgi:hypothetical protein